MLRNKMESHRRTRNVSIISSKAELKKGPKKKLILTCVKFLDKFKREVQCLFHQVVNVRSEDAVGLRADFYGCAVRCTAVKKMSTRKSFKLALEAHTETVLPHRLQGIGFRGRQIDKDRPDRCRGHLALKTFNDSTFQELLDTLSDQWETETAGGQQTF